MGRAPGELASLIEEIARLPLERAKDSGAAAAESPGEAESYGGGGRRENDDTGLDQVVVP